jgi:hypothetical protein
VNPDDLILVSADDHVVEPPDMFVGRLPRKYEAEAPHLVRTDDGFDVWKFRQYTIPNSALNAIAGRPKEEYGLEPQGLDEIRPGCYDVHERVKDMSAHSDSLWPYAPEKLHADFVKHNVPDDAINKITYQNAMRWYQFDPFAHVPREQATVGALRRSVSGHDISVQPRSTHLVGAQEKLAGYHRRVEAALSTAPTTR